MLSSYGSTTFHFNMPTSNSIITDQLSEHLAEISTSAVFARLIAESQRKANESGVDRIFTATFQIVKLDPLAVLERLMETGITRYFWERPDLDIALAAAGTTAEARGEGSDRFKMISQAIESLKKRHDSFCEIDHSLAGLHFLGGFSFFDAETNGDWKNFGTARFVVPEWLYARDGDLGLLTIAQRVHPQGSAEELNNHIQNQIQRLSEQLSVYRDPCPDDLQGVDTLHYELSEGEENKIRWNRMVTTAKENIHAGVYDKIVLARTVRVEASRSISDTRLVHHLRREYPNCYSFLLQFPDTATFVGSTPERLVSVQGCLLNTEGLAGSIPRGVSATDDAILEKRLLLSDKDQEEHRFVVESIMSRLREFTDDIHSSAGPGIRKFRNVQHLHTPIYARMPVGTDPFEVIGRLHPTPAVGGSPRKSALDGIPEFEGFRRGWYAGPVGWYNTNGRGEFSVAIRSGLIHDEHATFYAGCGIVGGSDPENEWAETELKLIPMMTALRYA